MTSWEHLLHHADPDDHLVHLYGGDDELLIRNIAAYVIEGIRRQELVLVVATPAHAEGVRRRIASEGISLDDSPESQVRFVDAATLLGQLLGSGEPDWNSVRDKLGASLHEIRGRRPGAHLRVFGEMVGLLWGAGRREEAEHLEASWNVVRAVDPFNLICAYPVDISDSALEPAALREIFAAHSHTWAGAGTLFSRTRHNHPTETA